MGARDGGGEQAAHGDAWRLLAYESLLLACGAAAQSKAEPLDAIVERLRPRLGVTKGVHTTMLRELARVPTPPADEIGRPRHRAALLKASLAASASPAEPVRAAFAERQRLLLQHVASSALADSGNPARDHNTAASSGVGSPAGRSASLSATSPTIPDHKVIEGWLNKMPIHATPLNRHVGFQPRYFVLRANGKLTWAHDTQGKKLRAMDLAGDTVVSISTDGSMHIVATPPHPHADRRAPHPKPPLVVRSHGTADGEGLRRWADGATARALRQYCYY